MVMREFDHRPSTFNVKEHAVQLNIQENITIIEYIRLKIPIHAE